MTHTTADVVNAASDVLDGIEQGTLLPAHVQQRAVDATRAMFGIVSEQHPRPFGLR